MPYPQAMRERAIAAHLEQGMKKIEVCRIFGIQRRSFDEWLRVYEKEGRTCAGGVLKCMLINGGQTKSNGDTVYLRCGSSKYHLLSPLPWAEYKAKRQIRQ